jgi:hypothetical protein
MIFLVAGLLLLGLAALVISLVPMVDCPQCDRGSIGVLTLPSGATKPVNCTDCEGTGRVTLLKSWMLRRNAQAR